MPQLKTRSPFGVWALGLVTLGIYSLVWVAKMCGEVRTVNPNNPKNVDAANAILSMFFGAFTLYIWPILNWFKFCDSVRQEQQVVGLQPTFSTGLATFLALIGFQSIYVQAEQNKVVQAVQARQGGMVAH